MANRDERMTTGRGVDSRAGARGLERLDDLSDFKVADGEPDIRGWDVLGSDRRKIGKVHDLLVDTGAMKVRYLDVELDRKELNLKDDRHVLVPIGVARLDDRNDDVQLPGLSARELTTLPNYDHKSITRDREREILQGFPGTTAATGAAAAGSRATATDEDFYGHGHFDDKSFWSGRRQGRDQAAYVTRSEEELAVGKRARDAGDVTVHKHVDTEHVSKQVPVQREEVTVERRPAQPGAHASGQMQDDEIRIPIREEEVVVEKRAVPKEEVVIRKEVKQETKTVEADLKKERIDVDKNVDRDRGDARR